MNLYFAKVNDLWVTHRRHIGPQYMNRAELSPDFNDARAFNSVRALKNSVNQSQFKVDKLDIHSVEVTEENLTKV